jgi:hypothetical protein
MHEAGTVALSFKVGSIARHLGYGSSDTNKSITLLAMQRPYAPNHKIEIEISSHAMYEERHQFLSVKGGAAAAFSPKHVYPV